jgi:tetratricopeptide (TPR) repeat protein
MELSRIVTIVWAISTLLAGGPWAGMGAQFGPLRNLAQAPQAKSPEELDSYLEILVETDAPQRIAKVETFTGNYPDSSLVGLAYQYQMLAYEELKDFEGVIRAGRKALPRLPENLKTLLTLSAAIANVADNQSDRDQLLGEAEDYARRALPLLERFLIARQLSIEEWERTRAQMKAQAHESLGQIAAKRSQWVDAVSEFQQAVESSPTPQGSQFLRLGLACAMLDRSECAETALVKASELGPEAVRTRSLEALWKVKKRRQSSLASEPK